MQASRVEYLFYKNAAPALRFPLQASAFFRADQSASGCGKYPEDKKLQAAGQRAIPAQEVHPFRCSPVTFGRRKS